MRLIGEVLQAHSADNQLVYIQVTRGVAPRAHAFPANTTPTVFIMSNPLTLPSREIVENGVACVTIEDKRWRRCDIKATSLLGNVLAAQYAVENGALEAIQFRDDFLSEGASSNIWVVRDGKVMAPPKDELILVGIRYGLMEEICVAGNIAFETRRIRRKEVFSADEVLMTSAGREVMAVVSIDGHPVGNGRPGPVFRQLHTAYQDAKSA